MNEHGELIQLDIELLDGYLQGMGSEVVKKMFTLYQQQVLIYLKDIERSLLCDNAKLWQEHCHKMKGAAGSVGLIALFERLKLMEKTTEDKKSKTAQLIALKIHNEQAIDDFDTWLNSL